MREFFLGRRLDCDDWLPGLTVVRAIGNVDVLSKMRSRLGHRAA
jgi:hypothetical protein